MRPALSNCARRHRALQRGGAAAKAAGELVVRPGAPSSVLAPSSKALVTRSDALVPSKAGW